MAYPDSGVGEQMLDESPKAKEHDATKRNHKALNVLDGKSSLPCLRASMLHHAYLQVYQAAVCVGKRDVVLEVTNSCTERSDTRDPLLRHTCPSNERRIDMCQCLE